MNNPICSVIVCYEPTKKIFFLINSLIKQNVYPIIIDNSERIFLDFTGSGYVYKKLGKNVGIADAQNIGIDLALALNAKAIVFFDQDSIIPDNLIQFLYRPIESGYTSISVPIYKNISGNFFYQIIKCNKIGFRTRIIPHMEMGNFTTNIAISSGSMVNSKVFNIVGKMDGSLFIDHVDTEWFLRANDKGFVTLVVTQAVMEHTIGDQFINLKSIKIPVHSPLRRYYRVRNNFLLLRYKHLPKILAIREIIFSFLHQFIILLYCKNRMEYLKYFFKAIKDGIYNKKGKISK